MTKIKNFFKSITNSKKKIFALALSVCVVVLSIAGSSIAYFTDTAEYTNTFTSGNVNITLTLNNKDVQADDFSDPADKAVPGVSMEKDTVITLASGSENAYFGAVITVTAPSVLGFDVDTVKDMFTALPTATATMDTEAGVDTFEIVVVFSNVYSTEGTTTASVFTHIVLPEEWDNDQMAVVSNLKIDVVAYAVQSAGFDGAGEGGAAAALHAAFPDAF